MLPTLYSGYFCSSNLPHTSKTCSVIHICHQFPIWKYYCVIFIEASIKTSCVQNGSFLVWQQQAVSSTKVFTKYWWIRVQTWVSLAPARQTLKDWYLRRVESWFSNYFLYIVEAYNMKTSQSYRLSNTIILVLNSHSDIIFTPLTTGS